jgi:hypothetical protein
MFVQHRGRADGSGWSMTLLNALDRDVEIVIRKRPRLRAAARVSVVVGVAWC